MARGSPYPYKGFQGGVNLETNPYSLRDDQARDVRNFQSTTEGNLRKRNGFSTVVNPTDPVTSLFPYNGSTDYLVSVEDDGATTDVVATTTGGTEVSIKAGTVTTGHYWQAVQAPVSGGQGSLFMVNGQDTPRYWDGNTGNTIASWTASAGSVPNGKFMLYHNVRVFVAGVAASPSTVYASKEADPRNWATPDATTTLVDPEDGEAITGLGLSGDYVLVFKPRKIYAIYDTGDLAYRNIATSVGCVSPRSIVETPVGTFFLSRDSGVYLTNGISVEKVSEPVDPLFDEMSSSAFVKAAGVFYDDRYFLSIDTSASGNNLILEFDTNNASWWIHDIEMDDEDSTTTGVTAWAILNPGFDATLYAAGADTTTPAIYEAFDSSTFLDNDTESYTAYWISGWTTLQYPHLRKTLRQLRADAAGDFNLYTAKSFFTAEQLDSADKIIWETAAVASSGSNPGTYGVNDSANYGDNDGSFTWGEGATLATVAPAEFRFYTLGTGRAWSFKFENISDVAFELYSYTLHMTFRKD